MHSIPSKFLKIFMKCRQLCILIAFLNVLILIYSSVLCFYGLNGCFENCTYLRPKSTILRIPFEVFCYKISRFPSTVLQFIYYSILFHLCFLGFQLSRMSVRIYRRTTARFSTKCRSV